MRTPGHVEIGGLQTESEPCREASLDPARAHCAMSYGCAWLQEASVPRSLYAIRYTIDEAAPGPRAVTRVRSNVTCSPEIAPTPSQCIRLAFPFTWPWPG